MTTIRCVLFAVLLFAYCALLIKARSIDAEAEKTWQEEETKTVAEKSPLKKRGCSDAFPVVCRSPSVKAACYNPNHRSHAFITDVCKHTCHLC
uniref:Neuropeptide ShK-like2 n=1 Tax=Nematostella vectensis TaxID=45351 RepID=SHKL2_NEMVE|nr:RecName: Full=Neuropeptide ShK-like2; AltName: Full=ShK-like2a; AltName: Full=ShK-like2b; Flags: Precursor [Nematostella vectensis]